MAVRRISLFPCCFLLILFTKASTDILPHLSNNNDGCFCVESSSKVMKVSDILPNKTLERLIVYFYIDPATKAVKMYTPDSNIQEDIPELPYQDGDKLISVYSQQMISTIMKNPNKILLDNNSNEMLNSHELINDEDETGNEMRDSHKPKNKETKHDVKSKNNKKEKPKKKRSSNEVNEDGPNPDKKKQKNSDEDDEKNKDIEKSTENETVDSDEGRENIKNDDDKESHKNNDVKEDENPKNVDDSESSSESEDDDEDESSDEVADDDKKESSKDKDDDKKESSKDKYDDKKDSSKNKDDDKKESSKDKDDGKKESSKDKDDENSDESDENHSTDETDEEEQNDINDSEENLNDDVDKSKEDQADKKKQTKPTPEPKSTTKKPITKPIKHKTSLKPEEPKPTPTPRTTKNKKVDLDLSTPDNEYSVEIQSVQNEQNPKYWYYPYNQYYYYYPNRYQYQYPNRYQYLYPNQHRNHYSNQYTYPYYPQQSYQYQVYQRNQAPNISDNNKGPFEKWFIEQTAGIKNSNHEGDTINMDEVLQSVVKILHQNGISITNKGMLTDNSGTNLDVQNISLRPILIGNVMPFQKLFERSDSTKQLPYLQAMLLTTLKPPKVLGIMPLGKTKLPMSALNSLSTMLESNSTKSKTSPFIYQPSDDKLSNIEFAGSSRNIIPKIIDRIKSIFGGDSSKTGKNKVSVQNYRRWGTPWIARTNQLIENNLSAKKHKIHTKLKIYKKKQVRPKPLEINTPSKISDHISRKSKKSKSRSKYQHPLDIYSRNDELVHGIHRINIDTPKDREEDILRETYKNIEHDNPGVLSRDGSDPGNITDSYFDYLLDDEEKDDGDFRIIGGNAATGSGTPVSNKGRSGLLY